MVKKYLVTITDDSGYESAFIFNNLKSVIEGIGIKYNLEFDEDDVTGSKPIIEDITGPQDRTVSLYLLDLTRSRQTNICSFNFYVDYWKEEFEDFFREHFHEIDTDLESGDRLITRNESLKRFKDFK